MTKDRWYIRGVDEESRIKVNTIATNCNINVGELVTKLATMVEDYALRSGVTYAKALTKIIEIVENEYSAK